MNQGVFGCKADLQPTIYYSASSDRYSRIIFRHRTQIAKVFYLYFLREGLIFQNTQTTELVLPSDLKNKAKVMV